MSHSSLGFHSSNFNGDRRHVNPMLSAILYVPPPPESIVTPSRPKKHLQPSNESVRSQSSFSSTVSLLKRKFRRGKH